MTQSEEKDKFVPAIDQLWKFSAGLSKSIGVVRWIGYGLLILAFFDVVEIFVPPLFMNPAWEFQTLGQLVERVPVPLLGLALVFLGERDQRIRWEPLILNILSWLALLVGILFFLLVPLGVVNTIRLDARNTDQITRQVEQRQEQIQQVKQALGQATTVEQMQFLISQLDSQGRTPQIQGTEQLAEVKEQLSTFLEQGETRMQKEAQSQKKSRRLRLLENSVKWNLGALVSGALFVSVWRLTGWARRSDS